MTGMPHDCLTDSWTSSAALEAATAFSYCGCQLDPPSLSTMLKPAGYFLCVPQSRATTVRGSKQYQKPPLTMDAQADLLMARGLECHRADLLDSLRRVGYYRLTGYLWWYRADTAPSAAADLIGGTTLDDIVRLYRFDQQLRSIVMAMTDAIEVWFRGAFSNVTGVELGAFGYLLPGNALGPEALARDKLKLSERVQDPSESFLTHFLAKYSDPYPPVWMMVELSSLGLLSKWYDNLASASLRQSIADGVNLNHSVLGGFLRTWTVVRNVAAHHGRLWNRRFATKMSAPRKPEILRVATDGTDYSRIYPYLATAAYLTGVIEPSSGLRQQLMKLLLSADDGWLDEIDAPRGFEEDAIWC